MSEPAPDLCAADLRAPEAPVEVVAEDPRWAEAGLERIARAAAEAALRGEGLDPRRFEVAVLGCDDGRIAALNGAFRGRPEPTNVLAWPSEARDPARRPEPGPLGDVALSFDRCAREARERGLPLADHAAHLVVHAVLHLLGHDHERDADAALMEAREATILMTMGLADPYAPRGGASDGDPNGRRSAPSPRRRPPSPDPS